MALSLSAVESNASTYLSFAAASERIPGHPSISTINRWSLRGVKGRKLKVIRIGGRVFTTAEFISEFLNELNLTDDERLARDGC